MAERAEALLAGTGWLPELLRTPGRVIASVVEEGGEIATSDPDGVESAANGGETAMADNELMADDEPVSAEPHVAAAA